MTTTISNLFNFNLVDLEAQDSMIGIESEIINELVNHFVNTPVQDLVKINDTHSFFKAFQKDYNPYQKMRERFRVLKKIDIFDNYFRIQEYEDELSSRTNKSHEFSTTKLQIRSSLNDLLR